MSSHDAQRIEKLEKELQELKAQLSDNANNSELQELKEEFNQGLQEVKDLLNVNNGQLAHMEMLNVLKFYVKTLALPKRSYNIVLHVLQYIPAFETFIRHGGIFYHSFRIINFVDGDFIGDGFIGYPHNFFNTFVKYCYETDKPEEIIGKLMFTFSSNKTLWPEQLKAGALQTLVEVEEKVSNSDFEPCYCAYKMGNKHKPGVEFKLRIHFERDAKYKEMTTFELETKV